MIEFSMKFLCSLQLSQRFAAVDCVMNKRAVIHPISAVPFLQYGSNSNANRELIFIFKCNL